MSISRIAWVRLPLAAGALLLGACTVMPTGPSVMALPGSRTSVEQFQSDAFACQQYAQSVVSTATGTVANADNAAANTAAAGAVLGAATGAIIGAATGQAGQGAAIGAGTGLLFGGMSGSYYTSMSSYQLQRGYDAAYLECMYARGNKVPSRGYSTASRSAAPYANEGPPRYPPPNQPPPSKSSIVGPTKPIYAQPPAAPGSGAQPSTPSSGSQSGAYPAPPDVAPGNYPPPDTPPPRK